MRTVLIWVLVGVLLVTLTVLVIRSRINTTRQFDDRITMREKHKNPYGFYAVRQLLPALFPSADIRSGTDQPGDWEDLYTEDSAQLIFFPCKTFTASTAEMYVLQRFISNGNHVFVIANSLSYEAKTYLGLPSFAISDDDDVDDTSLTVTVVSPLSERDSAYTWVGKRYSSIIQKPDHDRMLILGRNEVGEANFVQMRAGRGTLTIQVAPLAYSNYYLLQNKHPEYLEKTFSVIPGRPQKVLWSEYYLLKRKDTDGEPNWLSILFRFESFRWAFLAALALIIIYVLLEMRRKQRLIPVMKKPANESLDFVETIGRLYYDKKDHRDLALKMTSYFLEHIRSRYKIPTNVVDDAFANTLHMKSGYPKEQLDELLQRLHEVRASDDISEQTLYWYHKQLEHFYQTT
jgi:hypothetical protein